MSEDLKVALSTDELRCIARLLDHECLTGQAMLTQRDGSPWLEVDVTDREAGVFRYAIWRHTCLPFRLGSDGAVEDEPIWERPGA